MTAIVIALAAAKVAVWLVPCGWIAHRVERAIQAGR